MVERMMMRVATDATTTTTTITHSPIRMMSGRPLTENKKFAMNIKWKIGEMFTILTVSNRFGGF